MKHLFVPYELALLAKEKGFDGGFFADYRQWDGCEPWLEIWQDESEQSNQQYTIECPAPLYQQLVDWFREKHKILILPNIYSRAYSHTSASPNFVFKFKISDHVSGERYCKESKDYYEALNSTLTEAFKLINP